MVKIAFHIKKLLTPGKVFLASLISLCTLSLNYFLGNTSIALPDEMEILQGWDKFKTFNNLNSDSVPSDVLLVNVSYDKQLVDYEKDGVPVGQYVITDREKLLDFLTLARKADNYKYIMLDIIFEKGLVTPQDSALFTLIASMRNIVIPAHNDAQLQDSILYKKAANADYTVTWKETDFARYKFTWNDMPTMPLKMYEELDGKSIKRWGVIYTSNNWLCRNGVTLKLPIRITEEYTDGDEQDMMKYHVLQLGADLLALDSISPISDEIEGKIVVIGDFYTDVHETYVGPQPGSVICLNAYYALKRGDHILLGEYGGTFVFYLFMALFYWGMAICILNGVAFSNMTESPWLKLIFSFCSTNVIFWTIAIIAFITPLDLIYNVWVPIGVFSAVDFFANIYSNYQTKKHEKN